MPGITTIGGMISTRTSVAASSPFCASRSDGDPIAFWVLFLINMTIGLESPPFGLELFVLKGVVPHVPLSDIFKAQIPFIAIDVFAMLLIMNYPIIVTWLPDKVL